jgi:hypothetical protein
MRKYLLTSVCFAAEAGTGSESPADKLKREKAEKAEQDKLDAEKAALEEAAKAEEEGLKKDAELLAALDKKAAALEDSRDDSASDTGKADAAHEAAKHLESIALEFPLSTPDEHVVFGFAGKKFTLGQLRSLFNLRRGG